MLPFEVYLNQIVWDLVRALPWLLGMVLGGGLIVWSPLGKLLVRYLRDRARNDALLEANNAELAELTRSLGAMTERLDSTEQLLLRLTRGENSLLASPPSGLDAPSEVRTPTPH